MPKFNTPEPITATVEISAGDVRLIATDRDDTVVDVRLRGRDPEFTVSPGMEEMPDAPATAAPESEDDGGTWRVTLRLPEHLRAGVDAAARGDGLSVNAWLVRAVTGALGGGDRRRPRGDSGKHFSGWVR